MNRAAGAFQYHYVQVLYYYIGKYVSVRTFKPAKFTRLAWRHARTPPTRSHYQPLDSDAIDHRQYDEYYKHRMLHFNY